jgi:hypothetical protein
MAGYYIYRDLSKDILHIVNRMETTNAKTAWYLQHKTDPAFVISMREARRKYYYKNQEREQKRGRDYYHARKALLAGTIAPAQEPVQE